MDEHVNGLGFDAMYSPAAFRSQGGQTISITEVPAGRAPIIVARCSADLTPGPLRSSELASLGAVSAARHKEFSIGRQCARACLTHLAEDHTSLAKTSLGDVDWPQRVVGSIAHSASTVLCATAPASAFLSVGIDTEDRSEGAARAAAFVSVGDEFARFARMTRGSSVDAATAFFVAKEATLKAASSLLRFGIEYSDVTVRVEEPPTGARSIMNFAGYMPPHTNVALCHGIVIHTGPSISALAVILDSRGLETAELVPPRSSHKAFV